MATGEDSVFDMTTSKYMALNSDIKIANKMKQQSAGDLTMATIEDSVIYMTKFECMTLHSDVMVGIGV